MLVFTFACTLLNGSAVLILTALGSVSIPPALAATGLLLLRTLLPERNAGSGTAAVAIQDNAWLIMMALYGFVGAYTLPFLFRNMIAVVPLRPTAGAVTTLPLTFTTQNITTSFYILMTMFAAHAAHVTVNRPAAGLVIARLASITALIHAGLGWFGVVVRGTPLQVIVDLMRNGHYMQLSQSFESWARLSGISPEPSIYAAYGFSWLVLVTELWLRNVDRKWSGPAALILLLTLIASTSTTAYLGIGCYGLVIAFRMMFLSGSIPSNKSLLIFALGLSGVIVALSLIIFSDTLTATIARILRTTTSDKLSSGSGVVRYFWAKQGLEAFTVSSGLGIGVGSFRSSSIVTAVIGSGGVIAAIGLLLYVIRLFRPFRRETWQKTGDADVDTATACAWAAVMGLVPAAVSAPSPDPGILWGLFAGCALGLTRGAAKASSPFGALPHHADSRGGRSALRAQ